MHVKQHPVVIYISLCDQKIRAKPVEIMHRYKKEKTHSRYFSLGLGSRVTISYIKIMYTEIALRGTFNRNRFLFYFMSVCIRTDWCLNIYSSGAH